MAVEPGFVPNVHAFPAGRAAAFRHRFFVLVFGHAEHTVDHVASVSVKAASKSSTP